MNTRQLQHCIEQDKLLQKYCIGVYASDTVPRKIAERPICFIVNTDPISKPGKHWYAVYLHADGNAEVFDSYGREPVMKNVDYNPIRIQGPLSSTCGQFCLYYLCQKVRGRSMKDIVNDFSIDFVMNDLCVAEYVNRNFNLNVETYDVENIVSQMCFSDQ
jgi:hypothetical protein